MKPVIFMDIDGVLNRCGVGTTGHQAMIVPACVVEMNRVIKEIGAEVVLSSSWRYMVHNGAMTTQGFGMLLLTHRLRCNLIDITRRDKGREDIAEIPDPLDTRAVQVGDWLDANGHRPYVVIDDDDDGFSAAEMRFVHTAGLCGFTADDADHAIMILKHQGGPDARD